MKSNSNFERWYPWMRRVLHLASLADGQTSPNPLVGAVILDENENLVGEGFHSRAGEPHAEVQAILQAGIFAKNGTLVVNLEPCCHYGRTPPCSEAILNSGISRVVIGMKDPDPRVCGQGVFALEKAGVEVITGVLEEQAVFLNRAFIHRNQTGRPWGILKWAMSFDGRTGLPNGSSKWISGTKSRKSVHSLRSKCDAVIVGGETVRVDNPLLTSRGLPTKEPIRVVLSSSLDLPINAQLWDTELAKTLICYGPESDVKKLNGLPSGPECILLEKTSPTELLNVLSHKGCNKVLWECGGNLASRAILENCVQEIVCFLSPKLLGGISAMTPLSDFGFDSVDQGINLKEVSKYKIDNDFVFNMLIK